MDLGAYMKIKDLNKVMTDNQIYVPRLRGLRLMSDEEPLSKKELEETAFDYALTDCENLCRSNFEPYSNFQCFSRKTNKIVSKYMIVKNHWPINIKWRNLHGKKRKLFKFVLKQTRKKVFKQYETFNKYCGRDDILYIHARIGGNNWNYYDGADIEKQSWFIEKVDDSFDCTYCDIYAKIDKET